MGIVFNDLERRMRVAVRDGGNRINRHVVGRGTKSAGGQDHTRPARHGGTQLRDQRLQVVRQRGDTANVAAGDRNFASQPVRVRVQHEAGNELRSDREDLNVVVHNVRRCEGTPEGILS